MSDVYADRQEQRPRRELFSSSNGDYELGLMDFETYYTLTNVNSTSFTMAMRKLSFPNNRMNCVI